MSNWTVLVFVLALAFTPKAFAQNSRQAAASNLKALSLEELSNIEVITASKMPEQIRKTAGATFVLTQNDIRRSGVTNVADALRMVPGVEVGRLSSTTWAVGIRGLQSNFSKTVLVLIDGRSVYTPLFAGVYWDVQDLVLEDIDRIEVIRGPGGTIWGADTVNGVINIVTKNAADTHGLLASVSAGTTDQTIDQVRYGGGNGNGFDYRLYAKGFLRGPEFHRNGDDFDRWHQERGGVRMDWNRGADAYFVESDIYKGDSPHSIGATDIDDIVSGGNVVARWRRMLSNGSDLYVQSYFDRTIRIGSQLGETRNTLDFDFVNHLKLGARNEFAWGGGVRWSPSRFLQKTPSIDLVPHDETDHIYSGFVQNEFHLNDQLSFLLGAKVTHNNFSGFDAQPAARILWNRTERQTFWAGVTRAVATPSRIEEDFRLSAPISVSPPISLLVAGNPNFASESLIGYEAGYRQLLRSALYLDLAYFHNHYTHLQSFGAIVTTIEPAPPPHVLLTIPYQNSIAGSSDGFEIAPSWQAQEWLRITGSYSFVNIDVHSNTPTSDISSTGSVGTYEGSTPRHQLQIRSAFDLPKGMEADGWYRYASGLPAQVVSPYHTVDARFGWKLTNEWEISVVGQNLLQPHHAEWGTGDPGQTPVEVRRAGYVKLSWTSQRRP